MRILAVNWQDTENPFAGGAEIHLFEILQRLVQRGHSVTLLCSGFEGASSRAEIGGVEIHRVGTRYTFPLHARRYFLKHLASRGFDVILDDVNKVPLMTPRWSTVPVVALVPHLFGTTAFKELPAVVAAVVWLSERPIPQVYRTSLFHAISNSTADDLVARGVERKRIKVIYPGIDSDGYTPDASRRSESPLFCYVGRLKRYKGVDIILRGFAKAAIPDARLEIAGTGDYSEELRRLADQLGLMDRVLFHGFIPESDKLDLLRRSWASAFTSPKEGWGIVNLESQAAGTTVIASDSPGLRESLIPGKTGLLVPHGNVQALAEAFRSLANSPEKVAALGAAGRVFAASFSWDRAAVETEAQLVEAMARAPQ